MPIPTLQQADNGFYYVHWSEGRRSRRQSLGVKEETRAKERFAQWLMVDGKSGAADQRHSIDALWALYVEKHDVASEGARDSAWKNLQPHFGALMVDEIDQDVVDEYGRLRSLGKIGQPSGDATVRRELAALRAALNWCAAPKRKIIVSAPPFDLPPEGEARDRWLKTPEIQKLLTTAGTLRNGAKRLSRGERFLWLALETAARKTAILELEWDRVDFETNVIHLNVPGRKVTKKRRADVPISKSLRPVLERAYAERNSIYVMDNKADIWKAIQKIAEKAGVARVSPHVLRHTAATHMARRGVPLWKIAKILGNSLIMVEKVYAKHAPDDLREAVEMISDGALETTL